MHIGNVQIAIKPMTGIGLNNSMLILSKTGE
jgi:hypothetical protein